MFKIGDEVVVADDYDFDGCESLRGRRGRIVGKSSCYDFDVDFPGWTYGHDGNAHDGSTSHRFFNAADLRLAPPELKVGDYVSLAVRLEEIVPIDRPEDLPPAAIGRVIFIRRPDSRDDRDTPVAVEFDGWHRGHSAYDAHAGESDSRWWFNPKHLKRVDAPAPFIVISDEGASPKPYVHPTRAAAETEASRLAVKVPGMGFTVYQAVARVGAEKPKAQVRAPDLAA